jgi:replicative DNA helicase
VPRDLLRNPDFLEYGKIPPQNIELEEMIIGSCMLEAQALDETLKTIKPETFYKDAHQKIFTAIVTLYNNKHNVDVMTVTEQLRKDNTLEETGGPYFLTTLTDKISSTAHIETWCLVVKEKYIAREIIREASELQRLAYDESIDVSHTLDTLNKSIDNINQKKAVGEGLKHVSHVVGIANADFEQKVKRAIEGGVIGITTGIRLLDKITLGWLNGLFIILAARPSMGKTAIMLKFAKAAAKAGKHVLIYSIEMTELGLTHRLILSEVKMDHNKYRTGEYVTSDDQAEVIRAGKVIAELPIHIDDNPSITINGIRGHARLMRKKGECDIIMLDYIQMMHSEKKEKGESREQEVSAISRGCKSIAKELNVPFIALAQLNRSVELRPDKRPKLADLRESGSQEQDADIVLAVYRPEYYGDLFITEKITDESGTKEIEMPSANRGHLICLKHRDGATGSIPFYYSDTMAIIEDADYKERTNVDYNPDAHIEPGKKEGNDLPF